jgi:hypothetical protein
MRPEFFKGPGTYPLETEGKPSLKLEVDKDGYFETEAVKDFPIQVYAEPVD